MAHAAMHNSGEGGDDQDDESMVIEATRTHPSIDHWTAGRHRKVNAKANDETARVVVSRVIDYFSFLCLVDGHDGVKRAGPSRDRRVRDFFHEAPNPFSSVLRYFPTETHAPPHKTSKTKMMIKIKKKRSKPTTPRPLPRPMAMRRRCVRAAGRVRRTSIEARKGKQRLSGLAACRSPPLELLG